MKEKWFEIVVAALGVVVTGILGWGQWQLGDRQIEILENQKKMEEMRADKQAAIDQKRATDDIEVQVMSLVSEHLGKIRDKSADSENSLKVVLAASEYLSNEHGRTSLAKMVTKITEENESINETIKTRVQEATESSSQAAKWFAVLASIPANELGVAKEVANQKASQAASKAFLEKISLYKTKISNNYAVVIGGEMTQETASILARSARDSGLAKDAFSQKDRDWVFVGETPFK